MAKVLLIPFAVVAFVLFLLLLGSIGLTVGLGVLWVCGRAWGLVSRGGRPRRS